jgi:hypothetical protein
MGINTQTPYFLSFSLLLSLSNSPASLLSPFSASFVAGAVVAGAWRRRHRAGTLILHQNLNFLLLTSPFFRAYSKSKTQKKIKRLTNRPNRRRKASESFSLSLTLFNLLLLLLSFVVLGSLLFVWVCVCYGFVSACVYCDVFVLLLLWYWWLCYLVEMILSLKLRSGWFEE